MDDSAKFTVVGAGEIQISNHKDWSCGGVKGFDFAVSWGKHPYVGGVISREEAKKLADHIYKYLELPSPPKQ